jgi:hypothetical protein
MPVMNAHRIENRRYMAKSLVPRIIFTAPRFVIFVTGPVIINAAPEPMLIPIRSQSMSNGIVSPPQA